MAELASAIFTLALVSLIGHGVRVWYAHRTYKAMQTNLRRVQSLQLSLKEKLESLTSPKEKAN